MLTTSVVTVGCSGGSSSGGAVPVATTEAGVRVETSPRLEETLPTETLPTEPGAVFGDETNPAYVQLEAVRQPHAMPETFYETPEGVALAPEAQANQEGFVALGTSGTGYTMVGRDAAFLQYGKPELVNAIQAAGMEWNKVHPDLPMHLRTLSPQDVTQQFVGNLYNCIETYAISHIFARRTETYADDGTPVQWVTEYSSDNNGVVWHHLGLEADFQEFKSGAMNREMVDLIEASHQGTQPTRAYIFDVISQDNPILVDASTQGAVEIASPLHIDFHGDENNFEDAGNALFDVYNAARKERFYSQVDKHKQGACAPDASTSAPAAQ